MISDWLAAEPLLVAKLKAALPVGTNVLTAADLAGMIEQAQVTPAVHVIYAGDSPVQSPSGHADRGASQFTDQRWLIVIATRSAKGIAQGSGARAAAGPLIAQALTALRGFQPAGFARPLRRGSGLPPKYQAGFAYFPFQFLLRISE